MKKKLFIGILPPLLALGMAYATQPIPHPIPQNCPSVAAIQAVGVSMNAFQDDDGLWFTGRRNQMYGTSSNWTLIVGGIAASSSNDAFSKATATLSGLRFAVGPVAGPLGKWLCYYQPVSNYAVVTVNPPITMLNTAHPYV